MMISPIYCLVCRAPLVNSNRKNFYLKCSLCGTYFVKRALGQNKIVADLNNWANNLLHEENIPRNSNSVSYQRVNTLIRYHPGKKILDVGCGKGEFLQEANNAGFRVYGTDIAKPIRSYLKKIHIPSFSSVSEVDDNSFDVVTIFDVIEHTPDPHRFISELCRVLKPGGILMVSTPNAASLSARFLKESWWVFGPEGHYVLFTPESLKILLKQHGCTIIDSQTNTLTQWMQTSSPLINTIGNKIIYCILYFFLPYIFRTGMGDNIEVVARKK
jgi:2-polyprenyl-3-methyl-5-hydroxy-6-metoxy-1,4-benzoquinol methylase